jgi:hypothetical protein
MLHELVLRGERYSTCCLRLWGGDGRCTVCAEEGGVGMTEAYRTLNEVMGKVELRHSGHYMR